MKPTNHNSLKFPKLLSKRLSKRHYKTTNKQPIVPFLPEELYMSY